MRRDYLTFKQISSNWFVLKGLGVAFFGRSAKQVTRAYWEYMQSTNRPPVSATSTRVAGKILKASAQ